MTRALERMSMAISPLLLLLLAAGNAGATERELWRVAGNTGAAERELWRAAQEPDVPVVADNAVPPEEDRHVETLEQKGGLLGFNIVARDGYGGRAEPYGFLHSSPSGGLYYRSLKKDSNLELEGNFLNERDYHGDLLLDYRGDYRLHLRTESLFHNTDREQLFSPNFQAGRTDAVTPADYRAVQDPDGSYGISVVQDSADFRYRLHNYPLHVNLGYWRLVREGTEQMRFADTAFEGTPNTVYAVRRPVDQVTQEGRFGVDAHLGPVDIIYDLKIRVFEDRDSTPLADYVARNDIFGNPEVVGGIQQHNENPDSRFISNTIKLHTSLAGGLVGSGAYSIEQRENLSTLTDTTGARHMTVNLQNAAGDIVFTPAKEFSLAVKYRRQEVDNDNRGLVFSSDFVNELQLVKTPIDTVRNIVTATASWRPRVDLSVVGEYRGTYLTRTNVSALPSLYSWGLPDNVATQKGDLAINFRPVTGVRFSADYNYTTTDHPSYGDSFQQRHEGRLLASYTRSSAWGGTANLIVRREWNDDVQHFLIALPLEPLTYTEAPVTARDKSVVNANVAGWLVPVPKLTLGANYAYLQSEVDQGVFFTTAGSGDEASSTFEDRSHVFGVTAAYAFTDRFDLSLMLQQVRSLSVFQPEAKVFSATSSTSGIEEITRQHTVISRLSARGEYRITPSVSTTLEYIVRDYDEKNPAYSSYNGTVHTIYATVAGKW